MCYFCDQIGAVVPPHRGWNCRNTANSHSRFFQPGAVALTVTHAAPAPAQTVLQPHRGTIATMSLRNKIHPTKVDVARGAKIGDGATWHTILSIQVTGSNTRKVVYATGQQGTSESYIDVSF
jgi:hypothetical protein